MSRKGILERTSLLEGNSVNADDIAFGFKKFKYQ